MELTPAYAMGSRAALTNGGDILVDEGATLEHDVRSDVAELVDEGTAAEDSEIVDHDLAGHLHGVAHDDVVAHDTVVCDMAVCHDEAVGAHDGLALRGCAAVYGDTLAYDGTVADYGHGLLALELEVLGRPRYDSAGIDGDILADAGSLHDGDIGAYACSLAYLDVTVYGDERVDDYAGVYLGVRVDVC